MKSMYWAWAAILADFGLFVGPLPMAHSIEAFLVVWSLHACCCATLASITYALLPGCYRQPRVLIWSLMFGFAFIAPVMGSIGLLFVTRTALVRESDDAGRAVPVTVTLPEFDVKPKEVHRAGQGAIRMRLAANVPVNTRMQSLLTLQAVPSRVANPILERLLGDEADDLRLVAFGMLDAEEKSLTNHIHREKKHLEQSLSQERRHACLQRLAELHWELVYASLVQGELRKHVLAEARRYADEAIASQSAFDAGMHLLRGRILMTQGEFALAEDSIRRAVEGGLSAQSAMPYLAEIAFRKRDFCLVQAILQTLSGGEVPSRLRPIVTLWAGHLPAHGDYDHLAPPTRAIVDLWTRRESVLSFRNRHVLSHI